MNLPVCAGKAGRLLWHSVFWPSSKALTVPFVVVISIHFREYDPAGGVLVSIDIAVV
jgi:hypothetical protein